MVKRFFSKIKREFFRSFPCFKLIKTANKNHIKRNLSPAGAKDIKKLLNEKSLEEKK